MKNFKNLTALLSLLLLLVTVSLNAQVQFPANDTNAVAKTAGNTIIQFNNQKPYTYGNGKWNDLLLNNYVKQITFNPLTGLLTFIREGLQTIYVPLGTQGNFNDAQWLQSLKAIRFRNMASQWDTIYLTGVAPTPTLQSVTDAGNVTTNPIGIGVTQPLHQFHVAALNASITVQSTVGYSGTSGGLLSLYGTGMPTAANQRIGALLFGAMPTAINENPSAQIDGYSSEAWSNATAQGSHLRFLTTQNGTASITEKMRLTDNGRLGIGTQTPSSLLTVNGTFSALGNATFAANGTPAAGKVPTGTDGNGNWTWQTLPPTVTASNGLTMVSADVRLGGTLNTTTSINTGADNSLLITKTDASNNVSRFTLGGTTPGPVHLMAQQIGTQRIGEIAITNNGTLFLRSNNNGQAGEDSRLTMDGAGGTFIGSVNLQTDNGYTTGNYKGLVRNSTTGRAETVAQFATSLLGSGTANSSSFLRGDGTWQAIAANNIYTGDGTLTANRRLSGGPSQRTLTLDSLGMFTMRTPNFGQIDMAATTSTATHQIWASSTSVELTRTVSGSERAKMFLSGDSVTLRTPSTRVVGNAVFSFKMGLLTLSDYKNNTAGDSVLTTDATGLVKLVKLANPTITLTGDVTGSGTSSIATTLANAGTAGTYTKVTTDAKGRVTSGTTLVAADIPSLDAAKITTGVLGTARLGTGTANSTTFLRGDGTWQAPPAQTLQSVTTAGNTTTTQITAAAFNSGLGQFISNGIGTPANNPFLLFTNDVERAKIDGSTGFVRLGPSTASITSPLSVSYDDAQFDVNPSFTSNLVTFNARRTSNVNTLVPMKFNAAEYRFGNATDDAGFGINKDPGVGLMLDVAGAGNFDGYLNIGGGAASITGLGSASFTALNVSGNSIFAGNGTPASGKVPVGTDGAGNWQWGTVSAGVTVGTIITGTSYTMTGNEAAIIVNAPAAGSSINVTTPGTSGNSGKIIPFYVVNKNSQNLIVGGTTMTANVFYVLNGGSSWSILVP